MNPERLSRQAIRLAQGKARKLGRPLTRDEVLRLSVQTVEPWKRIVIALLGFLGLAFSTVCYRSGAPWWIWGPFGLGSATIVFCGVLGRKTYIDRELRKLSEEWPQRVLDGISNAL